MVGIMAVAAAEMMLLLAAAQKGVLLHDPSWCARHVVTSENKQRRAGRTWPRASSLA
jgi:hypothetical protein